MGSGNETKLEWGLGMRLSWSGIGNEMHCFTWRKAWDSEKVFFLVSQRRPHHPTNSSLETRTRKLEHKRQIVREDQEYDPIHNHEEDSEMNSPPTPGPPGMFWVG